MTRQPFDRTRTSSTLSSPQRLTYDSSRSASTDSLDGLLSSSPNEGLLKEKQTGDRSITTKNNNKKKGNSITLWRRRGGGLHRFGLLLLLVFIVSIGLVVSISMLGMRMQTRKMLKKHGNGMKPWQAFPLFVFPSLGPVFSFSSFLLFLLGVYEFRLITV